MPFDAWVTLLVNRLLWTSLQAVVLVGVIALIIRVVPRIPASTRCAMWWLVAAQVIVGLCWPLPVSLPLLAPSLHAVAIHMGAQSNAISSSVMGGSSNLSVTPFDWASLMTWQTGLMLLWLCGLLAQMPKLVRDQLESHRLVGSAEAPAAPLRQMCESLSQQMGLARCPRLRVSSAIASPMVTGLIRPVLLWPAAHDLSRSEASFVMAHELVHLRRRDLWSGSVVALAQWLFFFHPVVRWAVREYAIHREVACDAAAMRRCSADPREYGALLLRLGVSDSLPAALAGASATYRGLKRRLTMLPLADMPVPRIRALALVALVAGLGLVPYRIVSARATAPEPAIATPRSGGSATEASDKCVGGDGVPFCGAKFLTVMGSTDPHQSVVVFVNGTVVIDGTYADTRAAKQFFRPSTNLMWIRRGSTTYLVTDPAVLRIAGTSIVPTIQQQSALLDRQGALLKIQGALLREQGRLTRMRAGMIDASSQQEKSATREQASQSSIDARIRVQEARIDRLQRSLNVRQSQLDKEQKQLNEKSKGIPARLMQLADDAIARGKARAVNP